MNKLKISVCLLLLALARLWSAAPDPAVDPAPLPTDLQDHVFLDARAAGISSKLVGDVLITVIFVNDPASTWSNAEMDAIRSGHEATTAAILAEADEYDVDLNLSLQYALADIDIELPAVDAEAWADAALTDAGLSPLATASADLELAYHVDEAPILFYVNTSGRAYALSSSSGQSEYAIFYGASPDAASYRHELYHLFGAKDYYFPDEVARLAEIYFPGSAMLVGGDATTDALTAYLIGWTDTLSADALGFLQSTSHLTEAYMTAAHDLETYTGYVKDFRCSDTLYTGTLDFGVPHGYGTMVWPNGDRYEGDWQHGVFQGKGTFIWADSSSYTGDFVNGIREGEGTYLWPGGDRYTGEWSNGEITGYGTYTWADGTRQTGLWEKGQLTE